MALARIKLSKEEKEILRRLYRGDKCREGYQSYEFVAFVDDLESKGLVKGFFTEGHLLEGLALKGQGIAYIRANPSLRNPVNWTLVCSVGTLTLTAISTVASIIACSK